MREAAWNTLLMRIMKPVKFMGKDSQIEMMFVGNPE
jgi:hypothetical protein